VVRNTPWSFLGILDYALQTNPRNPFSLAYGLEVVIPFETIVPSVRRVASPANSDLNTQMLQENMDFIDERRDHAMIRVQNYQQAVDRYYNSNIKIWRFVMEELVLQKCSATRES